MEDAKTHQNGRPAPSVPGFSPQQSPSRDPGTNFETDARQTQDVSCLQKFSNAITGTLEDGFERLGLSIGTHPSRYIIGCFLVCALCALGLMEFYEETDGSKLWIPSGAQVLKDGDWIDTYFSSDVRRERIIGESSNMLTPTGLAAMLDIYQSTAALSTSNGITLNTVCVKAGSSCIVYSILEVWSYNDTKIRSLSQSEIISDINSVTTSPMYGSAIDLTTYLGTRTTNSGGNVTAAQAIIMTWLAHGNDSMEDTTDAWESKFIDLGRQGHADINSVYVTAFRSQRDEGGDAIQSDVILLTMGYMIVIIFVLAVLGKFNFLEQRAWLTLGGFVCIGLSILVSIGLSSAFQQPYSPLQSVLPFLLLGIGVDDMFVIMGALSNLMPEEQDYDVPHIIADVLRHAGVSITVTSLTDFVAFMIGATTIIPALRSFCIYAAIGIIALYVLQAIFFTSCLTYDLRRLQERKDACFFCLKKKDDYRPNDCSQKQFVPFIFKRGLAKIVTKLPFKIVVVVIAAILLGVNIWGFVELEQYFDPDWFLPSDSYALDFNQAMDRHFPSNGFPGYVYCGNIDYFNKRTELEALNTAMINNQYVYSGSTDSWFYALTSWLNSTADASVIAQLDANRYPSNEANFVNLTYYMTTTEATRTSSYLKFSTSSGSDITASRFPFTHIEMDDASTEIDAMESMRELVQNAGFSSSECFPYSREYMQWETNKVIQEELYRNLGLAVVCVFLVTLILIANLQASLMVFLGVIGTLVDTAGSMHFWGLTVDTVTSIILILSIGLAVDYSAHIGHMYMTVIGSRHDRTKETVGEMGPPVFYGGFSTFLAFILLSAGNSYVFQTFFKVNFLVVIYGLFHGLVFLPVLLSWIGPAPYPTADRMYRSHHQHHADPNKTGTENPTFSGDPNHPHLPHLQHPPNQTSYEMAIPADNSKGDVAFSPPPDYTPTKSGLGNGAPMAHVQT